MQDETTGKERLQKILARAGYGSRRACEELIVEGRVSVNDQTVTVLGAQADPRRDMITVDGSRVHLPKPMYWLVHKPSGMFFSDSNTDDAVAALVGRHEGRMLVAGRLDRLSSGVLLVTNDGRMGNLLTHPRYRVPKTYRIAVKNEARPETLRSIERALFYAFNGGKFERLKVIERSQGRAVVEMTAYEGAPASLRDIFLKYGLPVKSIARVRMGPLELQGLEPGASHRLRGDEVTRLTEFAARAEAGHLDYEGELVTPKTFDRSQQHVEFAKKQRGTRTQGGGQRDVRARVAGRGREERRPHGAPPEPQVRDELAEVSPDERRPGRDRHPQGRGRPGFNRNRPSGPGRPGVRGKGGQGRPPRGRRPR